MHFLKVPNLPESDVGLAAVSGTYPAILCALQNLGVKTLPVQPSLSLPCAVSSHADLLCHPLGGNGMIVARGRADLKNQLESYDFRVMESMRTIQKPYPVEAALDAARVDHLLFADPSVLDRSIYHFCMKENISLIDVKQGYAKCSIAIVNNRSIITSDRGIAAKALTADLDVLEIRAGFIQLPGYAYGFFGGTCGLIGKNRLAFTGDLRSHPDSNAILSFLKKRNIEPIFLQKGPLLDIGGILPLMEKD